LTSKHITQISVDMKFKYSYY